MGEKAISLARNLALAFDDLHKGNEDNVIKCQKQIAVRLKKLAIEIGKQRDIEVLTKKYPWFEGAYEM